MFKVTTVAAFLLILAGCAAHVDPVLTADADIMVTPPAKVEHYAVLADDTIPPEFRDSLELSLSSWQQATGGSFTYDVEYTSSPPTSFVQGTIVVVMSNDLSSTVDGHTQWLKRAATVSINERNVKDADLFRRTMTHELGHAFAIEFPDGDIHYTGHMPSVMKPIVPDDMMSPRAPEIMAFCMVHGCTVTRADEVHGG